MVEQQEKWTQKLMWRLKYNRGWILLFSVLFVAGSFCACYFLLPKVTYLAAQKTLTAWKIGMGIVVAGGLLALIRNWKEVIGIGGTVVLWSLLAYVLKLETLIGIVAGTSVLLVLIYFWWAPNNLYFTFVQEGTAKIVVRGDKFEMALIQWEGMVFTPNWNVIPVGVWTRRNGEELSLGIVERNGTTWQVEERDGELFEIQVRKTDHQPVKGAEEKKIEGTLRPQTEPKRFLGWLLGGFRYYGFWPFVDIYVYMFQWTGIDERGKVDRHEKEWLYFVVLKDDVYLIEVTQAEDKDRLPLDLQVLLTIQVRNPYQAIYKIQNWLETIKNRLGPAIRNRITQNTYEELITQQAALGAELFTNSRKIREEEFSERYGIVVRKIEVRDINPPKGMREETLKKFLAEREKESIMVLADAEAYRLDVVAEGEKKRIRKRMDELKKQPQMAPHILWTDAATAIASKIGKK